MKNNPKVFELINVRVWYGRLLHYESTRPEFPKEVKLSNPIQIPFGSVCQTGNYKFYVKIGDLKSPKLVAVANGNAKEEIQIFPAYKWVGKLKTTKFGALDVEVRQLINDIDRRRAMQLIMRAHYLNPPLKGLFLGCWLTNPEQVRKVRAAGNNRKKNSWSDGWTEPINKDGHMVGCAVLDTLYQGLPNGRKIIVKQQKLSNVLDNSDQWISPKDEKLRSRIIDLLGIAWASRFVVDEPYQGLQIGTLLAKRLVKVSYSNRVPRAKFIECITTESVEKAKARLENPKTSFLGKAGYTLNQDDRPSRRMLLPDENGNRIRFESGRKLYYFIETAPHATRK